jgi:hypothetical protein
MTTMRDRYGVGSGANFGVSDSWWYPQVTADLWRSP